MDKNNMNYNNFYGFSPYTNSPEGFDNQYTEFNPLAQYEQGYMYYKFLTQQLEYKIKCKEFERLHNNDVRDNRNERRVG